MDSCIFKFLMLQTKYSGDKEESNNEERIEKASENISFEGIRQRMMEREGQDVEVLSTGNLCSHFWNLHFKMVML